MKLKTIIENTRNKPLRELLDSPSDFKLNVYGEDEKHRAMTKKEVYMWSKKYNIGFRYLFQHFGSADDEDGVTTLMHLYPIRDVANDRYVANDRWSSLSTSIKVKAFLDAIKMAPEVLEEYTKKFGDITTLVINPATDQLARIYKSKSVMDILKRYLGSRYNIEDDPHGGNAIIFTLKSAQLSLFERYSNNKNTIILKLKSKV